MQTRGEEAKTLAEKASAAMREEYRRLEQGWLRLAEAIASYDT